MVSEPENVSAAQEYAIASQLLKFIYAAMLHSLPSATIRLFWDTYCREVNGPGGNLPDGYRQLWDGSHSPDISSFDSIAGELFAPSNPAYEGHITYLSVLLEHYHCTLPVVPSVAAKWMAPLLPQFLASSDAHHFLLRKALAEDATAPPGTGRWAVAVSSGKNRYTAVSIIGDPDPTSGTATLLSLYRTELWFSLFIRYLPRLFGLQPFNSVTIAADQRPPEILLPGSVLSDGTCFYNGEAVGKHIPFRECLRGYPEEKSITDQQLLSTPAVMIEKDIRLFGTAGSRLRKGCCYGAPLTIFRTGYQRTNLETTELLPLFITTLLSNDSDFWNEAEWRHAELLRDITTVVIVRYFKQEKKITLDDRRIASMVPAGILAYILTQYTRKNRTEFEYHELLENSDCTFDALAPNLSVRIKRLAGILEKKCPSIKILPTGRGTFSLSVNCNLRFVEK